MKFKKINPHTYELVDHQNSIGKIYTYHNLFHNAFIYLKFSLDEIPNWAPFEEIRQNEHKPLQVMIDSNETELVTFLQHNGFICKRHCFEAEVCLQDLISPLSTKTTINFFDKSNPNYKNCCHFLYEYYKKAHYSISPLTANEKEFITEVPTKNGYYCLDKNGQLNHVAFTEKNEIAYLCSINPNSCSAFINSLLAKMFKKYPSIFFEADDTDWAATKLINMFDYNKNKSFNTYIFE